MIIFQIKDELLTRIQMASLSEYVTDLELQIKYLEFINDELRQQSTNVNGELVINNSFVKDKLVPLIPRNGKQLNMYICGPTVYSDSHLGHARTYLAFDIIIRILKRYFNYNVTFAMNITDIDDKIINRSRELGITTSELANKYEKEFFEDMKSLNIEQPDVILRVTEHLPEIIEEIKIIIANGYAYVVNGSVYFDVQKFNNNLSPNHAKLDPARDLSSVFEDEDGPSHTTSEKRFANDFALWKSQKNPYDPCWESPFGQGRPGWHIECSAMATHIFGEHLDIHGGGVDLKFPHHHNEISQAEAHYNTIQWTDYFIHTGHLNIDGRKMSKSLKNFITIREALRDFTGRQIRFFFLMHNYDSPMDYTKKSMENAKAIEQQYINFFQNVNIVLIEHNKTETLTTSKKWSIIDRDLHKKLLKTKDTIHKSLCTNFDTPMVMQSISNLIKFTNIYITKSVANQQILISIITYIKDILALFGLDISTNVSNNNEFTQTILETLSIFRDNIRSAARANDNVRVLTESDNIRDNILPELGVRLEDRPSGTAAIKLDDRETLLQEKAKRIQDSINKKEEAAKRKAEAEEKQRIKMERTKIHPDDMFNSPLFDNLNKYSQTRDDSGIPTHLVDGTPISKKAFKNLKKEMDDQTKIYIDSIN